MLGRCRSNFSPRLQASENSGVTSPATQRGSRGRRGRCEHLDWSFEAVACSIVLM